MEYSVYPELFTFYNIYIKTYFQHNYIFRLLDLHSIIFILKLYLINIKRQQVALFTFYNIYIKTK